MLISKISFPRIFIPQLRAIHPAITNKNILPKLEPVPPFLPKMKGVCVTLTSPLNSPTQVVRHSSLYTAKGYHYLCFKLSTPSTINAKWKSHILKRLDGTEGDVLFHLMLPSPNDYLSILLNNWQSSVVNQPDRLALKGVIIDKILSSNHTYHENVTVGVSSLSVNPIANETEQQDKELLVLNLSIGQQATDNIRAKLNYKSVLHNFLDLVQTA
ncbi:hypothetical protein LOD99_16083 [Oopsacas minuta]|uniref:Uncharacterized protein n=1 Tax=Oopsacas minuta TaxID=111878 RepID=A0AAV7K778_9METZ|nr:hypothetical protein LOD99_16083 [Oopsacas minuta]